ncbi:hypothetical protein IP88_13930 [alpha proteobacterium AAP81b]|nr:hypothetical protein IP88_13930 [alpha proteobacterium AAP81b]
MVSRQETVMLKILPGSEMAPGDAEMHSGGRAPIVDYPSPAAVLADGRLSRSERLRVLDAWVRDIADRDIAANEATSDAPPAADEKLLRDVNAAIAAVEATPTVPANLFGRIWQILARD